MKHNKFSWIQEIDFGSMSESVSPSSNGESSIPIVRSFFVENWLRDPNVGTQRLRFHVKAVEKVGQRYRIKLVASTSAVEKILSNWGEGQWYTLNGMRRRT